MVVMTAEDGTKNFAIDSFPEMREDMIEAFQIEAIERRRRARDEAFDRIERELEYGSTHDTDLPLARHRSRELLAALEDAALHSDRRERARKILDAHRDQDELELIVELAKLSTSSLANIAKDPAQHLDRRAIAQRLVWERLSLDKEATPPL